jgi:hypothetical protein
MARKQPVVQVEGAREVRKAMKRMDKRLDDMKDVHQAAGEPVAEEARVLVPVDDGDLRGSIRLDRRAAGVAVLAGKRAIPYAGVIHFGWAAHGIEPDPFLYEAADARADEVRDRYAAGIADMVERYDRETPDNP